MNGDEFFRQIKILYERITALQQNTSAVPKQQEAWLPIALAELNVAFEELQVAEEELREQNEQLATTRELVELERQRYRDLFELAPDGYLVTNAQGKIQEANRAAAQLLNVEPAVLIGKPLVNFIPQPERRDFRTRLNQLLHKGSVKSSPTPTSAQEWDVHLQPKSSKSTLAPINASITVSATYDEVDQLVALRWLLRDVTQRKQVEERLRLLESVAVNTNEAILITEADPLDEPGPRILYANEAFTRTTGYTQQEVLGKSPRFMQGPQTDRSVLNTLRAAMEKFEPVVVELINYRKDGSEFWVELSLVPVADDTGCYTHFIAVQRDITERKRAEAAHNQLTQEQIARREAEGANRMKDEFLSVLSHEVRTPLNAILGWANLLRSRTFDPATTAQALETIERNARSQAHLIDDLLDVSRIIQDKLVLDMRPVKLVSLIQAAIETVRPVAEAKSVELLATLDDSASLVFADYNRLQQVVWNLLSNAVKFTPTGGRVEVCLEAFDAYAQIQVRDTGTGIAPGFLPYVFERFRQADSTLTRSHAGLGLGLAIVRRLVELHGGTVEAKSAGESQGATFTVKLPLREARTSHTSNLQSNIAIAETRRIYSPVLEGLHVLIVDDEADTRELYKRMLEQAGARVTAIAWSTEAVEVIEGRSMGNQATPTTNSSVEGTSGLEPIDVLLSNIRMPEEDGYTLIRRLRALKPEQGGQIPAAAITACAGAEDRSRALSAGFQMHIPKPIEPAELISVVTRLSGRAQAIST